MNCTCFPSNISIHALREEGDLARCMMRCHALYFYPRPPRGGRHPETLCYGFENRISIHALREEGDGKDGKGSTTRRYFYPRPPRGGRRAKCLHR